ncbi:hypothetical protein V2J94_38520 [Streptomyces sp. DSM 41524]|uniref:Uncharacterized protein n=1 Tax=Streptomyces asiaticus subsp. ignotus TaxID=3098222 RepID=A0ABU7Q8V3_9ACTN|nr:hypothetical protein [Streptomyces sp. DSM 41524]
MAASSERRTIPRRRSSAAPSGAPVRSASSAALARAAPRRVSRGGRTSRTVTPHGGRRPPGSRRTARSPTRSGSSRGRVSLAVSAPSGRTVTGTAAVPMCRVTVRGRSRAAAPRTRTSIRPVSSQWSGVSSTWPRPSTPSGAPCTLTATRATPLTADRSSRRHWSPRTRSAVLPSPATSRSPARRVPAPRVPVTTVP